MSEVENAIEVLKKLVKYNHKLEEDNAILLEVARAASAWSDVNHDSKDVSMDEAILVADKLEQSITNLKVACSVGLLKKLLT